MPRGERSSEGRGATPAAAVGRGSGSSTPDRSTEAARARQLQQIATDLLRDVDAVADEVAARVVATEPRLDGGEAVVRSTRDNVGAILAMLAYGVPGDAILP